MDWLGTFANILQVVTSISFLIVAWKWGRTMLKKHEGAFWGLIAVLFLTVIVTVASLADKQGWMPSAKPEQVFNKHFHNEDVVLDNHEYFNCIFENVNLKYGGGYFRLDNVTVINPFRFTTTNLTITRGMKLMDDLKMLDRTKFSGVIAVPLQ